MVDSDVPRVFVVEAPIGTASPEWYAPTSSGNEMPICARRGELDGVVM